MVLSVDGAGCPSVVGSFPAGEPQNKRIITGKDKNKITWMQYNLQSPVHVFNLNLNLKLVPVYFDRGLVDPAMSYVMRV